MSNEELKASALEYHRAYPPGKLAIQATKPLATQRDLALAYSPGVAAACEAIVEDPQVVSELTSRGNLVAVITNGTAVLGLGNIGPLAAKPVMEGKAVLFKQFAGIDVFDLEIAELDAEKFVETVARLEPSFGAINLEDIKAPECFYIEEQLRNRMGIPVFHDDQHGTAIIVGAAIRNGLKILGKNLAQVKLVTAGAGAAALACLNLLVRMGLPRENIFVTDLAGVVYEGRNELMDQWKAPFAQQTTARTLEEVITDADIFLGLSAPRVLKAEWLSKMADRPLILALANPTPEILPEEVKAVRPDAIIATGRSDYPNQVNNVLCFPFIFRGALDVGATTINHEMELACVEAVAQLAQAEVSDEATKAYGGKAMKFGSEYLIPRPFDPRLILHIAPAVAQAAMDTGVATRPIENLQGYREKLSHFVYRSGLAMKPLFTRARAQKKRLIYAEGEGKRVLQAVQQVVDEGLARPVLVGRPSVIEKRIEELGLRLDPSKDVDLINILKDARYHDYWQTYHAMTGRRGISPEAAQNAMRTDGTVVGVVALARGEADAMLCGTVGRFAHHLRIIRTVVGMRKGVRELSTVSALILPSGPLFIADTHVNQHPNAEDIAEMVLMAADEIRAFGIVPKVALLSRSNFGTHDDLPSASLMRTALGLIHGRDPDLEVDGEMHADAALSSEIRERAYPESRLKGMANLLVMPNLEAGNIAFNLLKQLGGGYYVGPILLGARHPAHVVSQSITVRGLVNMSALAVAQSSLKK